MHIIDISLYIHIYIYIYTKKLLLCTPAHSQTLEGPGPPGRFWVLLGAIDPLMNAFGLHDVTCHLSSMGGTGTGTVTGAGTGTDMGTDKGTGKARARTRARTRARARARHGHTAILNA